KVIPLYIEVLDTDQWLLNFSDTYFRTYLTQYFSFKHRIPLPLDNRPLGLSELMDAAKAMNSKKLSVYLDAFQGYLAVERAEKVQQMAFGLPALIAELENRFCLVMVDEIQYMTKYIYHDKAHQAPAHTLPGAYHSLVESKIAPMLVSGSYTGWMQRMMTDMGWPFKQTCISPKLAGNEGMEAVYLHAKYNGKNVSEEAAMAVCLLTQSDPFYIGSLFRSDWEGQDFMSTEGVVRTLAYEVRNEVGEPLNLWSEYIDPTLRKVNDRYAKKILLFLSKNRCRAYTRPEIAAHLGGDLDDAALDVKLRALEYGDLIARPGTSRFRYCGIPDDILDLIFRELYQEEIGGAAPDIESELAARAAALEKEKNLWLVRSAN
ncbi:MAG: hypothetical protein GY862_31050, partial [Gammaproteobacteria bacterium]|nr:hypothetical protein [Gammaproteobacteria bacterium]